MDPLRVKIEGKGNGIKTVLLNISEVASQMSVGDPMYLAKYLGIEVGSRTDWDKKRNLAIIRGSHTQPDLQQRLFGFIKDFVLCPSCSLPELKHVVKGGNVGALCYSCGFCDALDDRHPIFKFVVKRSKANGGKGKMSKKQKQAERQRKREMKRRGREKQREPGPQRTTQKQREEPEVSQDVFGDLSEWDMDEDSSRTEAERLAPCVFWEREKESRTMRPRAPKALMKWLLAQETPLLHVVSEFDRMKLTHKLDATKHGQVLIEAAVDFSQGPAHAMACFKQHEILLGWYTSSDTGAHVLMGCFEAAVCAFDYFHDAPMMLETLYDCGILTEDFLVAWYSELEETSVQDLDDVELLKTNVTPLIEYMQRFEFVAIQETSI